MAACGARGRSRRRRKDRSQDPSGARRQKPVEKRIFMMPRLSSLLAAVAVLATAFVSVGHGASKNFTPDVVFTGSSLTSWRPIGQSTWRAENGEIVGTSSG